MSVRVADVIETQNGLTTFPVAYGKDVWLDKNKGVGTANYSDLQTMYNSDELGSGGSSIQVDTMPIASAENENMIVQYVGESGTYQNGYFYQSTSDEQDPPTYSWVQKNVQPSNATATNVSYDNTTSELVATNVQDAIDEIKGGLGTASGKNFTDLVRPNSHELVESGSVYSAINNALSSIYTPRGELTCAELTSSLLIEDNVGNIYTMSDSGTTSALFINGAGQTINVNDNVGIIKAGANTYLFNLMGDAFDLHDYQKKELSSGVMIEDVIPSNASVSNKLVAKSEIDLRVDLTGNIDLNEYYANGKYIARNGTEYTVTNAPSDLPYPNNGFSLEVMSYGASDGNTDAFCTQILTAYTSNTVWIRSRFWGSDWFRWTNWQKLATTDEVATKFDVTVNATSNPIDDIKTVVNQLVNMSTKTTTYCGSIYRVSSGGVQGCFGNYDISVYIVDSGAYAGNTHVNGTLTFGMGGNSNVEDTYSVSCSIDAVSGGETYWKIEKLVTTDDIFHIGDRRDVIGWADLSNTVNVDGSSNYANNIGRIEGRNAIIQIKNPSTSYQWPVTNSGDNNCFIDLGSSLQFFIDRVSNHLYVRYADSVDMSSWGEIATKSDLPTSGVGTGVNKQDIVSGDANTTINIPAYHFCSGFMYLSISGMGTALLSYDIDFNRNLTLKMIAGTGMLLTGLTLYKGQTPLGAFSTNGDYIVFSAQYYTIIRTNYASL